MKNVIDPHFQHEEQIKAQWVSGSSLMWGAQTPSLSSSRSQSLRSFVYDADVPPELGRVLPLPESTLPAAQVSTMFFEKNIKIISHFCNFTNVQKTAFFGMWKVGSICQALPFYYSSNAGKMVTLQVWTSLFSNIQCCLEKVGTE